MVPFHVIIIGAGSTGTATAHDLALRGFQVTVVERNGVASGTTGHNQGQLHSGARYAVYDPVSACECMEENKTLRKIMPECLELNDGLFVALTEEHLSYRPIFLEACARCGIPAREIPVAQALRLEPHLNPRILAAIQIPDGVFDPYRFCLSFLASARKNGARVLTCAEVTGVDPSRGRVEVRLGRLGKTETLEGDFIINASGPWVGKVASLAGLKVEVEPSAGVMVTVGERLCNMVLNILSPPADGDILVPLRQTCILGTTSWRVNNPDDIPIPPEHVESLFSVAEHLIPEVRHRPIRGVMASIRPLPLVPEQGGRATSRNFVCHDHAPEGRDGMISILGGKTTIARLMAEKVCDMVCAKLGHRADCRTKTESLLSHRLGL